MYLMFPILGLLGPLYIPSPTITPLSPGLKWEITDAGFSRVTVHFSVNQKLDGSAPSQFSKVITQRQGKTWMYEETSVVLKPGDTIHYWVSAVKFGLLLHDLDNTWTYDPSKPVCTSYPCLVFEDNFDTLDLKTWEHEITAGGGGNWEFQYYTNNRSNSYVRDGVLYIKPTLTSETFGENFLTTGRFELWGMGPYDTCTGNQFYGCERQGTPSNVLNPIQSARLRSSRGFNLKYGKVEVEAQLPAGDWLWPAIWMMPTYASYGGWPASGEIDIMESRGNRNYTDANGKSQGVNAMGSTLHFGPNYFNNKYELAHVEKVLPEGTFADAFHKFGLEWTEDHLKFFVDDELIMTVDPGTGGFWQFGGFDTTGLNNPWAGRPKMAPFDQEFYLIMNVAVGGMNFFPDSFTNVPYEKPWKDADKTAFWNARDKWYPTWNSTGTNGEDAAMKINYVKVWKLKA